MKRLNSIILRRIINRNFSTTLIKNAVIPIVIDKRGATERAYDIYSRLLRDRIICLFGPVDDQVSSTIVAQLLFLQSEDKKAPIHMYINSPGGVVTAGLAIYDTMNYIRPPIATWCVGQACSMGSLLLAAGTPGFRYALPHSRVMVHQPSGAAQGYAQDIKIQAEEIIKTRKMLNEIYEKVTGQDIRVSFVYLFICSSGKTIEKWMERDYFMSAKEAASAGLVDSVIKEAPNLIAKIDSTTR